jgi:2,5-diamino-6-(ribosylamino)-4(3H)-pyrimidinone 5'-phosphate reductase
MLPRVILHNALSVDGRMDWIAPDLSLYYELAARWEPDLILCGSNTALTAFPSGDMPAPEPEPAEPLETTPDDGRPLIAIIDYV